MTVVTIFITVMISLLIMIMVTIIATHLSCWFLFLLFYSFCLCGLHGLILGLGPVGDVMALGFFVCSFKALVLR